MSKVLSNSEALELSFERQARLNIIHPWQDGNKRTSRLLSNFIQEYYGLPLGKVLKEDSAEYLQHLKEYKDNSNLQLFLKFMTSRYLDVINKEILDYKKSIEDEVLMKNAE